MNNDFDLFWLVVGSHGITAFASCADGVVTVRPVSTVIFGGKFFFQTDESYTKFRQIAGNPNAALCCKNISVQGTCVTLGRPADDLDFMRMLKKYYPLAAARYSSLPGERVIGLTPVFAYRWIYEKGQPYREQWDFEKGAYEKLIVNN
ncbi:MAG: pyridoxamine 5'-phosphate oxidase family protein [Ruminococcus sp.]|nr:pyridoxamine 5'-phosphate oxidase family protein [Ruminococcus sp.]